MRDIYTERVFRLMYTQQNLVYTDTYSSSIWLYYRIWQLELLKTILYSASCLSLQAFESE
jgi:hypothetical protein